MALSSLAGCTDVLNGGGSGGMTAEDTVPAQAGAVVSIDVEAMLNDDDLKDIANTGLDQLRELPGENDVPEDVDSAIETAQDESDLDPTGFNEGLLFMDVAESGTDEDYAGIVMETDWSEDELIDFLESENDGNLEESEYGGKTIYTGENDEGGLGVLADGRYVIGPRNVLEDTIDVANGDGDAISDELSSSYDSATDGHLEFASVVPDDAFTEGDFEDVDPENFQSVKYMSGSLYKNGSSYGVEMNMRTDSEETASALQEDIESLVNVITMTEDVSGELEAALDDIEYTTDGQTLSMSYEEDVEQIKTYVEEYATTLLFLLAFSGAGTTI
ncbi:MAG: hypothetical protein V5A34_04775 [Halapricum sp.]